MTTGTPGRPAAQAPALGRTVRRLVCLAVARAVRQQNRPLDTDWRRARGALIDSGASVTEVAVVQTEAAAPVLLLGIPGAQRWTIYHDGEPPDIRVEAGNLESWGEHIWQREDRLIVYDQTILDVARGLPTQGSVITHLNEVDRVAKGAG